MSPNNIIRANNFQMRFRQIDPKRKLRQTRRKDLQPTQQTKDYYPECIKSSYKSIRKTANNPIGKWAKVTKKKDLRGGKKAINFWKDNISSNQRNTNNNKISFHPLDQQNYC